MLGKLPELGCPANLIIVWQRPTVLAVGAGGGYLDFCSPVYHFSLLSPSLGDGPMTEMLSQSLLVQKQPTSQSSR